MMLLSASHRRLFRCRPSTPYLLSRTDNATSSVCRRQRLSSMSSSSTRGGVSRRRRQHPQQSLPLRRSSLSLSSIRSFSSVTTTTTTLSDVKDNTNVLIVGGGIIGTSVAYHLGKAGVDNVLLVEQSQLTSGTTWHAAGLMTTYGSMSSTSIEWRKYTKQLYSQILPSETGLETGFMDVGFIEVATTVDHLHYFRRVAAFNRLCGIDVREISPAEVKQLFPLVDISDIIAGFYVEDDGRVNPTDATMALAKGARQYGVRILENVTVENIHTTNPIITGSPKRVEGVTIKATTTAGDADTSSSKTISANVVVNCAGMWARQFGEQLGVVIPNQAAEHYYLITEPIDGLNPKWPVVEDPSKCIYIRPEGQGLLVGFFEWDGAPWSTKSIPNNFSFGELEPDWDRMEPYLMDAMTRLVPEVQNSGIKKFFCGPESFTPDNSPVVGMAPEIQNYYVAAGLNSIGILTGGGVGKTVADWIINDGIAPSDVDVTAIKIDRFQKYQTNLKYRTERVSESLGNTYRLHYPDHQPKTCRGAKKSPLYDRLVNSQNAYMRDVSGYEAPGWYAPPGIEPVIEKETFGRPHWFPYWEAEHKACREDVALFEMSFMSKFLVQGYDAGRFLNWLSTANVDGPCNQITYTQWLNETGYLEADLTIIKMSETEFMVVATDTQHHHVWRHMTSRLSRDWHVCVSDVTSRYAQINLQGPKARDLLQSLTSRDLMDDGGFEFRTADDIDLGLGRALCTRITYVGELGYELFIPSEQATLIYDDIVDAGKEFDLRHAGLKALGSLRLEKGYRDYGHDMDNTDTIWDAGLSFTIDWDKDGGFIGVETAAEQKRQNKERGGRLKRMANILVPLGETDPLLYHGEVLWRNGAERISDVRAGSYGFTVGGGVGLTMLESKDGQPITNSWIDDSTWELEIADKLYPCQVSLSPLYDPKNKKIKPSSESEKHMSPASYYAPG